jgi:hypothetical protein
VTVDSQRTKESLSPFVPGAAGLGRPASWRDGPAPSPTQKYTPLSSRLAEQVPYTRAARAILYRP